MDNKAIREKLESTAIKLLDCAEKAAERSAAKCSSSEMQNIKDVVDSALNLLSYQKSHVD